MRLVEHITSNENRREQVTIAFDLPFFLKFLSITKFSKYKTYECIGWTWYDKETGKPSFIDEEIEDLIDSMVR